MTEALDHIRGFHDELTEIRRDIHANPELGLEEYRTAELVARKLEEWGIEVHRGVGGTGVVGVLRNGNGQMAVGLRADMVQRIGHAYRLPAVLRNIGPEFTRLADISPPSTGNVTPVT